jgi:hypothetical protein
MCIIGALEAGQCFEFVPYFDDIVRELSIYIL